MHTIYTIQNEQIPPQLKEIPKPPNKLYIKGKLPDKNTIVLCVVGARKNSSYGEKVCKELILGLRGYNICIVSGLAIGIDSIAHRAATEAGLQTIAFPGSGLNNEVLYPTSNRKLADEILYNGGALISEFEMDQIAAPWTFPQRNRLMAGMSKAVLVIEAGIKSGTLITSRLATDYNRDVGAVPGQIFSSLSEGPNMLIRSGAIPITNSNDILEMLGFNRPEGQAIQQELLLNLNDSERKIINYLQIEPYTSDQLILKTEIQAREINEILSSLEIQGLIEEKDGKIKMI